VRVEHHLLAFARVSPHERHAASEHSFTAPGNTPNS
jgi:hypothetical protein